MDSELLQALHQTANQLGEGLQVNLDSEGELAVNIPINWNSSFIVLSMNRNGKTAKFAIHSNHPTLLTSSVL